MENRCCPACTILCCRSRIRNFQRMDGTNHVGATGADFQFSFIERCLIAGRAIWFYLGKLAWPEPLIFNYPRWQIRQDVWWQYVFPLSCTRNAGCIVVVPETLPRIACGIPAVLRNFVSRTGLPERVSVPLLLCGGSLSVSGVHCSPDTGGGRCNSCDRKSRSLQTSAGCRRCSDSFWRSFLP